MNIPVTYKWEIDDYESYEGVMIAVVHPRGGVYGVINTGTSFVEVPLANITPLGKDD